MAGGVVLGFPFYAILVADAQALLGPLSFGLFWILHMALSTTIGLVFSVFVAPRAYASSIASALVLVLVGVYGGGRIVLMLAGVPLVFDARAAIEIVAHVVYALVLGSGYVWLHRAAMEDARVSVSPKWRAWGRRQRGAR